MNDNTNATASDSNETTNEGTFDMGAVSQEDPAAVTASNVASLNTKPARKVRGKKAGSAPSDAEGGTAEGEATAEPKEPKVPQTGEYGKRGLPTYRVSLNNVEISDAAKKHHQRRIILDLLSANENEMAVGDIITTIESTPSLLAGMNTNQPIIRCVAYQVNELVKLGMCSTTKPERAPKSDAAPAEKAAETEGGVEVVEGANEASDEAAA